MDRLAREGAESSLRLSRSATNWRPPVATTDSPLLIIFLVSELVLDTLKALSGDLNLLASGDDKPRPGTHDGLSKVPPRRYLRT